MEAIQVEKLDLPHVLRGVASELDRISSLAETLQAAVSELLTSKLDPDLVERLQGFDLLAQEIQELGLLLHRVSHDTCAKGSVPEDILSRVRLSYLKAMILGVPQLSTTHGEAELW